MATLDDLLQINGVIAAGEFAADGKLLDFKTKTGMSKDLGVMTAQFCATVTMLFNTLAAAHSKISGMNWLPQHGWMYAGGEWTIAVGGTRGVFIETSKADFNQLFKILVGR